MAKPRTRLKPPAVVGREHQTRTDALQVVSDGAVRKKARRTQETFPKRTAEEYPEAAHRVNKGRHNGAEPEHRGEASKPERMWPSARQKSGGERSQSVHSTEALPEGNTGRQRAREQKLVGGKATQEFR